MRTIRQLSIPQDGNDSKFPDGQIRNESTTETGTPVVREIYGDILTNIYKILRDAGITPNQQEDSETNDYQFLEALKVFANNTNDKRQLLNVSATNIVAGFNFDNMPQNYVFIGLASEALSTSQSYSISSGSGGAASYPVTIPSNIPASSTVLVILNSSGSTIVGLGSVFEQSGVFNTAFGTPLSFNESETLYYLSQGILMTDYPRAYNLLSAIEDRIGKPIVFIDAILFKERVLCLCFEADTLTYRIFSFRESNLNVLEDEVYFDGLTGADNQPYMYCDGKFIYFTNTRFLVNGDVNDFAIQQCGFDSSTLEINLVSILTIDDRFEKTTNVFIDADNQKIFTFVQGVLYSYPFSGENRTQVGFFPTIDGVVFEFNGNTYYSNGNVATKWNY